jgi:hypothetical protein
MVRLMPKWEYCVLRGFWIGEKGAVSDYPRLYKMTENGLELVKDFKNIPENLSVQQVVAQMVFQLGEEGWELTTQNTANSVTQGLVFKRQKN